jgi:hypothetical protein
MLGGAATDEQFPLDDDDLDPFDFHFHGFGQLGQGPPPSLENNVPPMPNLEHLAAMGWGVWPQPTDALVDDILDLIPMNDNVFLTEKTLGEIPIVSNFLIN